MPAMDGGDVFVKSQAKSARVEDSNSPNAQSDHTASTAFLEALDEAGVSYIFANFGSDHPALIEALAAAAATGAPAPKVITCPFEMVGLSAAHGFAQITGRAQAVVVHVDCGTQSLAGAVHNAAKGRIPVLIFAGLSPFTQEGELKGSRNEFIHWIQDSFDQRGIMRGYVKYDNEFRSSENVKQITHRAMQFAHTDPKGPVYLVGAREVMEQNASSTDVASSIRGPIAPVALPSSGVKTIADALTHAKRPIIVTSYLGRNPHAVQSLVDLTEVLGIGVLESAPNYVNFPHDNPLYQGMQWNQQEQNETLGAADVVLVIDSDIPWIPKVNRPSKDAAIFHIDIDPLKEQMPLWHIDADMAFRADAACALTQICDYLSTQDRNHDLISKRKALFSSVHAAQAAVLRAREKHPSDGTITPQFLVRVLRDFVDDDTIIVNEGITNYQVIFEHLALTQPGSILTSGGGSLGWNGGAAIGAKLAAPEKTIVALTGDGSYMFSIPSAVHWMARQYNTPFLQIVLNNRGWKAPRFSMLAIHPDGHASRAKDLGLAFDPPPDYAGIAAAAGGAYARSVKKPGEVERAIADALHAVKVENRSALLDIWLKE